MNKYSHTAACGHLGCSIRLARLLRGWTMVGLARRARVHHATICRIEKGVGQPLPQTVAAVREALGLDA